MQCEWATVSNKNGEWVLDKGSECQESAVVKHAGHWYCDEHYDVVTYLEGCADKTDQGIDNPTELLCKGTKTVQL